MSRERLDEIEAREQAATPGPWEDATGSIEPYGMWSSALFVSTSTGEVVAGALCDSELDTPLAGAPPENRAFIAAAREDVPWLVAQVRERDAEIVALKADASVLRQRVSFEANAWQAARQELDERDAEIARLRAELATVTGALRDPRMPAGLARNIADLRALSDGWLDGEGLAPDRETLDWLEKTLPRWVAGGMPVPILSPTEDGLVCAEWPVGPDGMDASAEFHACVVRAPMKEAPDA